MREPHPPGAALDLDRVRGWLTEFSGYRINVTEDRIERWLGQFAQEDRDLAARLLDAVLFVSTEQVAGAFRSILAALDGWAAAEGERQGRWYFVPFTGSAGESGDAMLQRFRHANNLAGRRHNGLFRHRSELVGLRLGPEDTVVLVDDFSGTGTQACGAWEEVFRELLAGGPRIILALVAARRAARERIERETDLEPHVHIELGAESDLFSDKCRYFSAEEKAQVLLYGETADPHHPRGWGDCGLLLVFSHTCPNNSLPVLHARRRGAWEGLFRRYD